MSTNVQYDVEAMKRAIKQCDLNIKVFEDAILREMNTKMEYQRIVRVLEEGIAAAVKPDIKVEIVHNDDDDLED